MGMVLQRHAPAALQLHRRHCGGVVRIVNGRYRGEVVRIVNGRHCGEVVRIVNGRHSLYTTVAGYSLHFDS